jgi:hypothetical protein
MTNVKWLLSLSQKRCFRLSALVLEGGSSVNTLSQVAIPCMGRPRDGGWKRWSSSDTDRRRV